MGLRPMDEWKRQRAAVIALNGVHRGASGATTPRLTGDVARTLAAYWRNPLMWIGVSLGAEPPPIGTLDADKDAWLVWGKRASAVDVDFNSPAVPELYFPRPVSERAVEAVVTTAKDAATVAGYVASAATGYAWDRLQPVLWAAAAVAGLGAALYYVAPAKAQKEARAAASGAAITAARVARKAVTG